MKTTKIALMMAIMASLTHPVLAENNEIMMPPPGPYRSIGDVDQYKPDQNVQNGFQLNENRGYPPAQSSQPGNDAPEWVRQRQAQMGNWMNQTNNMPQAQNWNNPPTAWNYNRAPVMPNAYSGQAPIYQNNRMQQTFPSARGPVYGPGAPPAEFYNQPAQQMPRY